MGYKNLNKTCEQEFKIVGGNLVEISSKFICPELSLYLRGPEGRSLRILIRNLEYLKGLQLYHGALLKHLSRPDIFVHVCISKYGNKFKSIEHLLISWKYLSWNVVILLMKQHANILVC